jgi:hypothetical protein
MLLLLVIFTSNCIYVNIFDLFLQTLQATRKHAKTLERMKISKQLSNILCRAFRLL